MSRWIDRLLVAALVVVVAVLCLTALPFLAGHTLGGPGLLTHMFASGALVIGLPVFALAFLRHLPYPSRAGRLYSLGFLATVALGFLTIATVFLCMLPVPATEQMHALMTAHGWIGFAMVPAIVLLLLGMLRSRRTASHLHS
ncbi:hypothetical protein FYK55_04790 [Roseiconus nitratireducens]|uniref:DUF4405 domain-containing protein n=1 Tax=Roseiconus nitratireducens TaxID=2605748 RepID=A0A5M6DIX4_9BACT|nr:hypothetical protein [Roseiconus nitratireducens]KAA5546210.1 hypothetical protein FYK55_04790 [Roseiconus nitratireducens]